jgi:eukaryotic-like serine/threonine-protein kinase
MICQTCQAEIPDTADRCPGCGSTSQTELMESSERETLPMEHWSEPAAGSSEKALEALAPGSVIGDRYEVIKLIGKGGMGAVCQVRDREVDRVVALKVVRGELAGRATALRRFKRELVLAQKVTHPNVVRIYDLGVAGSLRFITMEYIEGSNLSEVLAGRGKLPPREAVEIMIQVSRGLAAAHAVGIIHRDLKPANIMIDAHGRAVVMVTTLHRRRRISLARVRSSARQSTCRLNRRAVRRLIIDPIFSP